MSDVLARWNALPAEKAMQEILACCSASAWAKGMAARRPIRDEAALLAACNEVYRDLRESDWMEAFRSHPRIGETHGPALASGQSMSWSKGEQQKVGSAGEKVKLALAKGNRDYEERFKRTFIVCATGKSGGEILEILQRRLKNDEKTELLAAAEEQRKIAQIRLKKWLAS